MATRERVQKAREATRDAIQSFEEAFKIVDRLADTNASDEEIDQAIADSGIPADAFVDAYKRYTDAGGVVEYGAGRALLQGLTLGFADEIEAALPSAFTGIEGDYEQRVGQIRAGQKAYEGARPGEAMAAEVVGALPTLLVLESAERVWRKWLAAHHLSLAQWRMAQGLEQQKVRSVVLAELKQWAKFQVAWRWKADSEPFLVESLRRQSPADHDYCVVAKELKS